MKRMLRCRDAALDYDCELLRAGLDLLVEGT